MFGRTSRGFACLLLIMIPLLLEVHGEEPDPLRQLIAELDCDHFETRTAASMELQRLGTVVVVPLSREILARESVEFQIRGLEILKRLAMDADETCRAEGLRALEEIASQGVAVVSLRAASALEDRNNQLSTRAIRRLAALGAKFKCLDLYPTPFDNLNLLEDPEDERQIVDHISFDGDWQGGPTDLAMLRDLPEIQDVLLEGSTRGDDIVRAAASLPHLRRIVCYKTAVTSSGWQALAAREDLAIVAIAYTPVHTEDAAVFLELKSLEFLSLLGTGVDEKRLAELEKRPNIRLDVRNGAFLGVSPNPESEVDDLPGVSIQRLIPNSPADRFGLRSMDTILRFNDKPVDDFLALRTEIGRSAAGDRIVVEGRRDNQPLRVEVELDAWAINEWMISLPRSPIDLEERQFQGLLNPVQIPMPPAQPIPAEPEAQLENTDPNADNGDAAPAPP